MSVEEETPSIKLQEEFRTEGGTNDSGNVNLNQTLTSTQISGGSQSLTAPGAPLVVRTEQVINLTYLRSNSDFTSENILKLKDDCRRKRQAGNEVVIHEQFHANLRDQIPGILMAGGMKKHLAQKWDDALKTGTLSDDQFSTL